MPLRYVGKAGRFDLEAVEEPCDAGGGPEDGGGGRVLVGVLDSGYHSGV